jgi:hypothetical protein
VFPATEGILDASREFQLGTRRPDQPGNLGKNLCVKSSCLAHTFLFKGGFDLPDPPDQGSGILELCPAHWLLHSEELFRWENVHFQADSRAFFP